MENNKNDGYDVIKKIYDGEISYIDKPFISKQYDDLRREINDINEGITEATLEQFGKKYEDLLDVTSIECFAQGVKFMFDLFKEISIIKS